jgi:glycosyltransferase involved in cell wall biosynthesis
MPLKIGLVTGEYPPMQGGVGAFTRELAKALALAGCEIHIITDRRARPAEKRQNWRLLQEPIDLGFAQLHARVGQWRWPVLTTVTDIVVRQELDVLNIQYQAAAYHMRSPAINFLPWRLKGITKTVVTFHDLRVPYLFPKAGRIRRAAVDFMARQAHGVVVTNAADYESMSAVRSGQVRQIPIGSNISTVEVEAAAVAELRSKLNISPDHFLLGYFGFLNESKGADLLIQALAHQPENTHLLFIGGRTGSSDRDNNQDFYDHLLQASARLNLLERVHFTGFVSDREVAGYLAAADLMVMPYRDGVSLRRGTLMAVLAHGRPLLTTRPVTPIPELVHGRHAYLVPAGQVEPLSNAICELMADRQGRIDMGREARSLAASFSWDRIAEQTSAFFASLVLESER